MKEDRYLIQLDCVVVLDALKHPPLYLRIDIGDFHGDRELETLLIDVIQKVRDEFCQADEALNLF